MKKIFISAIVVGFFATTSTVFSQSITLTPNQMNSKQGASTDNITLQGTNPPNIVGIRHRGTLATPAATGSTDYPLSIEGRGHNGTIFTNTTAKIVFMATENYTPSTNGTNMQFYTSLNGTTTLSERMRIENNGYVGIGSSSPAEKLTVQTATNSFGLLHTDGTVSVGSFVSSGGGGSFGTKSNHPLYFFTNNGGFQMALLQNGNFGVGAISPSEKLTVQTASNSLGITHTDGTISLSTFVGGVGVGGYFGTKSNHPLYFMTNNGAAQMTLTTGGNVGIGITSPTATLVVARGTGGSGTAQFMGTTNSSHFNYGTTEETYIRGGKATSQVIINDVSSGNVRLAEGGGNVGIGIATPHAPLQFPSTTVNRKIVMWETANDDHQYVGFGVNGFALRYQVDQVAAAHVFYAATSSTTSSELMRISGNGNVGIGTNSPNNKLDVLGTIRANEVIVETGWADYVFENDYKLKSIDELESFVKENKHLPNIPKAADIEKNGLKVGETNKAMMEKIEELALYVIQLKKEIDILKAKN